MTELVDVLDEFGDKTGQVASREQCLADGLWHGGAKVYIISTDRTKALLLQRSANEYPFPNQWGLLGGRTVAGETSRQAAAREVNEELGIVINSDNLAEIGTTKKPTDRGDKHIRYFTTHYLLVKDIDETQITFDQNEVQAVRWWSREEICRSLDQNDRVLVPSQDDWSRLLKYMK